MDKLQVDDDVLDDVDVTEITIPLAKVEWKVWWEKPLDERGKVVSSRYQTDPSTKHVVLGQGSGPDCPFPVVSGEGFLSLNRIR